MGSRFWGFGFGLFVLLTGLYWGTGLSLKVVILENLAWIVLITLLYIALELFGLSAEGKRDDWR